VGAHRLEIDGLRALAVIPVILFHGGFAPFSGGYVGVDVFFVISGFLITSIILEERRAGVFSMAGFYERRARRILPALFFAMAVCIPVAWVWMLPKELASFGQSLVAVSLFVSNMFFWRTSGYFDLAADQKPLLHTWSLGVEEQFYLIFPLVIALFWRLGAGRLLTFLVAMSLVSFLASDWMLSEHAVGSFFLAPTRAWELFAGSLLAITQAPDAAHESLSRYVLEGLGALGLALILVPVFIYDASTPFPGRYATLPVIGTVLVLTFAGTRTWTGRLLTLRPMLWIGGISYSAYLWHQPLFAFARLISANRPARWLFGLLAFVAVGIAHISWRFVERPFRDRRNWSRRAILVWSVSTSVLFVVVGVAFVLTRGAPNRWSRDVQQVLIPEKSPIEGCPRVNAWLRVCRLGALDKRGSVVLVGDSHAFAIAPALSEALARENKSGYLLHTDCFPIAGMFDSREPLTAEHRSFCAEANRRLREFTGRPEVTAVIVAIRWTLRLYPMGSAIDAPGFDNQEGGVEDVAYRRSGVFDTEGHWTDSPVQKEQVLLAYLDGFAAVKRTVLLYPIPEVGWTPARLNLDAVALHRSPFRDISTSEARITVRNAEAERLLDTERSPNVRRVRPKELFCNIIIEHRCAVQAQGTLYYYDDNHLSMPGARLVAEALLPALASE
jgi:peptidoglycan/LPS O-acetylase OafA/YrhL